MDELETLNMLLRLIGSSPVNSLSTDHPDAANARATMKRVSRRLQRTGYWCNMDYNVILQPNNQGEIVVSNKISSLIMADPNLVLRGVKLYDKRLQTGIFTSSVTVDRMVRLLDWDDMPPILQEYVAYSAASEFVRDELEDANKEESLKASAGASYLDLKKQDLEAGQYNVFHNSRIARARAGIRPYAQGNKRFHGDPDA
jgi:hypothetical protein